MINNADYEALLNATNYHTAKGNTLYDVLRRTVEQLERMPYTLMSV